VGQRESRAESSTRKGIGVGTSPREFLLVTSNSTVAGDVSPRSGDLSPSAAVHRRTETNFLSREWFDNGAVSGNAKSVRSSGRAGECPTTSAVALVPDIVDDLGALGPVGGGVKTVRDVGDGDVVDRFRKGHDLSV